MDNSAVFLGVRIPDVPYNRVCIHDVNLQCSVNESGLRDRASDQFKLPGHDIVFVYRGRTLDAQGKLEDQGVRNGATIHVMRKTGLVPEGETSHEQVPLTEDKLRQITFVFKRFTASRLWEVSHPRVLCRILKQYPAIRDDLGALAILRDPILLSSMKTTESLQEIGKQYNIFIQAASSIADILHKLDSTKVRAPDFEDSESSSSSSSSEDLTANNAQGAAAASSSFEGSINNNNNNDNNNNGNSSGRQITQQQLAEALAFVGAAFRSSQTQSGEGTREPMELTAEPADAESTSNGGRSENPNMSSNNSQPNAQPDSNTADLMSRYSQELVQMREMGLIDEQVNLQALQICNGDLEAAINLVFSSSN